MIASFWHARFLKHKQKAYFFSTHHYYVECECGKVFT